MKIDKEKFSNVLRTFFNYHQKSINISKECKALEITVLKESEVAEKKRWRPYTGVLCIFLSCVFLLLISVIVKKISYISPSQFSLIRNMGVFIGSLPLLFSFSQERFGPRKDWLSLALLGFSGATAMYLLLLAYKLLPMALAAILLSTTPIVVTIVAYFTMKEAFGGVQILSIVLTLTGVILSVHVFDMFDHEKLARFHTEFIFGLASAFGTVAFLTYNFLTLKKMSDIHFSVNLMYLGFFGSLENAILTFAFSSFTLPQNWIDTTLTVLVAVLGFAGHSFFMLAVKLEATVGVIATCKSSIDFIIAMLFDYIFFDVIPDFYNISGGILVILAVALLGLWKWLMNQPKDSPVRERFQWILPEK